MLPIKRKEKPEPFVSGWTLLTLVLLLLLSGCATPTVQPAPVKLPALPTSAEQPTKPPICEPTCLDGLTKLRESLADSLTKPTKQD